MSVRVLPLVIISMLLFGMAMPVAAEPEPAADPECLREELDGFLAELGALPGLDPAEIAEGRRLVAEMPAEALSEMQERFAAAPHWRELPRVMGDLGTAIEQKKREDLQRLIEEMTRGPRLGEPGAGAEYLRANLLSFVTLLRSFIPIAPQIERMLDDLELSVRTVEPEALPNIQEILTKRAAEFNTQLGELGTGRLPVQTMNHNFCHSACTVCGFFGCAVVPGCVPVCEAVEDIFQALVDGLNDIINGLKTVIDTVRNFFTGVVSSIVTTVAALPNQIAEFFTGLWDKIKTVLVAGLNKLLEVLPRTVDQVLAFAGIDLNNINWNDVVSSLPQIAPICPQDAVNIAADICGRGGDFITELVFNIVPEDGLSLAVKIGVGLIHFPLSYLCQCADGQNAIAYAGDQEAHRDHTSKKLDLALSTRASQASVNVLQGMIAAADVHASEVDGKLVELAGTAGRILQNVTTVEADVAFIQSEVNSTETTTGLTEGMVDKLLAGNETQHQLISDFTVFLTRLHIENNLLENRPDTVSLFQLPKVFGGHLETVGLIVADTIRMNVEAGQNIFGALRELERGDMLRLAGDFIKAYEAYRSAYTEAVR